MHRFEFGPPLRSLARYCLAVLSVFIAFWIRNILDSQFGIQLPTFVTFYPAVILSALIFGMGPGLLAVVFSALIVVYWIIEPVHSFIITSRSDLLAVVIFIGINVTICLITERMRLSERRLATLESEARVRASRNLLKLFIEHSMNSVAMFNKNMVYMTASDVWCREYGVSKENLIGRSHYEVFPKLKERWMAAHQRGMTGETVQCAEDRLLCGDGRVQWLRWEVMPWRRADGSVGGVIIFTDDITDQKEADTALRVEHAKLELALASSPDATFITDTNGDLQEYNDAFATFFRFAHKSECILEFKDVPKVLDVRDAHDNALPLDQTPAMRALSGEVGVNVEYVLHRLDIDQKWLGSFNFAPIRDPDNNIIGAVVTARDVTELKKAERQLRQSEELYRTAFKTSLDAILITEEATGRIIDANTVFQQLIGYQGEEIRGKTTGELGLWAELPDRERMRDRLRRDGAMSDFEFLFKNRNGDIRYGLMSASVIDIGGQRCIHSVLRDVTEEKIAAEKLWTSEERYRTAFQTSIDAITITRMEDGRYLDVNRRFEEVTEYSRDEIIGKTSPEMGVWEDRSDRERFVNELKEHSQCRDFQTRLRKKSGKHFWAIASAAEIMINNERCILTVVRDVTDAKLAEEQIRNLAYFDPLTGLANRRMLLEGQQVRIESDDAHQMYRALVFIDLSNFRALNDAQGHSAGDKVLREVGKRLTSFRRNAGLVSRIGGDEFAVELISLGRTSQEAAAQAGVIAEEIHDCLEMPYELEQRTWNLSCCIGIVVYASNANDPNLILQQGDIALAQAKSAGPGSIRFFEASLQSAVEARAVLDEELRQALKNNEFELYYQPQMEHGQVIGAEALLRWNHPRHGLLTPGHFIPLAEENGLIFKLGEWVIDSACRQLVLWSKSPLTSSLSLSINISSLDIKRREFVQCVYDALERTGAEPTRLQLEITESVLMKDVSETIAKMHILKKCGVRFSIDDFGTGYSSLAYLKRFPIDELKIDISFVRDILIDNSSSTIAQAIISLGKALDLVVIAEGVESEAQHMFLEQLGCRIFQGYLFGHPAPIHAFNEMLERSAALGAVS